MKSNIVIFTILTIYFIILAGVYSVWNLLEHQRLEWSGSLTILLSGGLTGFIAFYLALVKKKQGGVLVEDADDSDIDDGDPEIGEFSPWSWWPMFLAFGASVVVLGLCLNHNFWLSFLGLPVAIVGVIGWIYEYYRGHFAR